MFYVMPEKKKKINREGPLPFPCIGTFWIMIISGVWRHELILAITKRVPSAVNIVTEEGLLCVIVSLCVLLLLLRMSARSGLLCVLAIICHWGILLPILMILAWEELFLIVILFIWALTFCAWLPYEINQTSRAHTHDYKYGNHEAQSPHSYSCVNGGFGGRSVPTTVVICKKEGIYVDSLRPRQMHHGNQSRGCFNGGRPRWPPAVPRLAARPSQSNPRGSGPEVLKRERGHVTVETWSFCGGGLQDPPA